MMRLDTRIVATTALGVLLSVAVIAAQTSVSYVATVRLYNSVVFARGDLQAAQNEADGILRAAGINVLWRECQASRGPSRAAVDKCSDVVGRDEFVVRLVSTPRDGLEPADTLGYSFVDTGTGAGTLSTVLVDRVTQVAKRLRVTRGRLLGRVMAHELGHLLLGTMNHADTGLMRAHWPRTAAKAPQDWQFSTSEAAQIHAALRLGVAPRTDGVVATTDLQRRAADDASR